MSKPGQGSSGASSVQRAKMDPVYRHKAFNGEISMSSKDRVTRCHGKTCPRRRTPGDKELARHYRHHFYRVHVRIL